MQTSDYFKSRFSSKNNRLKQNWKIAQIGPKFQIPYVRHYNPLLIRNPSWILTIHKVIMARVRCIVFLRISMYLLYCVSFVASTGDKKLNTYYISLFWFYCFCCNSKKRRRKQRKQNLHWNLGQQTPSVGTFLAYRD